jgi:hypothetical protein
LQNLPSGFSWIWKDQIISIDLHSVSSQ